MGAVVLDMRRNPATVYENTDVALARAYALRAEGAAGAAAGTIQPLVDDAQALAGFALRSDVVAFAPKLATGETTSVRETDTGTHAAVAGEVRLDGTAATVGELIPNEGRYTKQAGGTMWRTSSSERQLTGVVADEAAALVAGVEPRLLDSPALAPMLRVLTVEQGGGFALTAGLKKLVAHAGPTGLLKLFKVRLGAKSTVDDAPSTPISERLLPGGLSAEFSSIPDEAGLLFAVTKKLPDGTRKVAFGVPASGPLIGRFGSSGESDYAETAGYATRAGEQGVLINGDSMSARGVPWLALGQEWPALLAARGIDVFNPAVAGQTAGQIIARGGGDPCLITVAGNQIPASGSVAVTALSETMVPNFGSQAYQTLEVVVCGLRCNLVRDPTTGNHRLDRLDPGPSPIVCPSMSPVLTKVAYDHQERTRIDWYGRNGSGTLMSTVLAKAESSHKFAYHGRFLQIGVCNLFDGSEDAGTSAHDNIRAYANYQAAHLGSRFWDLQHFMVYDAVAAAGITEPSSDDLAARAAGRISPRFQESGGGIIHFNALGNILVEAGVYSRISAKGWVK